MRLLVQVFAGLLLAATGTMAFAQGASVPFGIVNHDNTLPIEVGADSLSISQKDSSAEFIGNVKIGQGELKISADKVTILYSAKDGKATGEIDTIHALGHVTLSNGAEAAEGAEATYQVATGLIVVTGQVLLTQGNNALSGDTLEIDLKSGTANVTGHVQTVFRPGSGQ